jgi:hypothetical protein
MTKIKLAALLILMCILQSCCWIWPSKWWGGCPTCYGGYVYEYTHYKVEATHQTAKGMKVDASLVKVIDLAGIDARVDKIEACLLEQFRQHPTLTDKQRADWGCWPRTYKAEPIKRDCITVKLVPPVPGCYGWDMLPDLAPEGLCRAKGLEPTPTCPCRWREVIQGDYILVTTPTRLPMWDIVTIVTGCSNAWTSPFAACMKECVAY